MTDYDGDDYWPLFISRHRKVIWGEGWNSLMDKAKDRTDMGRKTASWDQTPPECSSGEQHRVWDYCRGSLNKPHYVSKSPFPHPENVHNVMDILQISWKDVRETPEQGRVFCVPLQFWSLAQGFGLYFVFTNVGQNELRKLTKSRHLKVGAFIINWNEYFSHFPTDVLKWQKTINRCPPWIYFTFPPI